MTNFLRKLKQSLRKVPKVKIKTIVRKRRKGSRRENRSALRKKTNRAQRKRILKRINSMIN